MSLAGGRYVVVNASLESRVRHTDGLQPGAVAFSDIYPLRASGPSNRSCARVIGDRE